MKKMLRFVGIAALAAVIGFGFASCEGPAGLTGTAGAGGQPGDPGEDFRPAAGLSISGAARTDVVGVYEFVYPHNLAIGEVFYHIITLQNNSPVDKDIVSVTSTDFIVTRAADEVGGPILVPLSVAPFVELEQGGFARIRLTPLTGAFGDNATNTGTVTITGYYGGRSFTKTIEITLTVGVDVGVLERRRDFADALLAEIAAEPTATTSRAPGGYYVDPALRAALVLARDAVPGQLAAVNTDHGNATTRVAAADGQLVVTGHVNTLNAAITAVELGRNREPFPPMLGTWTIATTPAPALGNAITVTIPSGEGIPTTGFTYQWQRQVGSVWVYIPGASARSFTLLYGAVRVGDNVRAVIGHPAHRATFTNAVVVTAPAATPNMTGTAVVGLPTGVAVAELDVDDTLTANVAGITNPTTGLTFQWQRSVDDGATWTNLGTANTHDILEADQGNWVRVVISHADFADYVTIHVVIPPAGP